MLLFLNRSVYYDAAIKNIFKDLNCQINSFNYQLELFMREHEPIIRKTN